MTTEDSPDRTVTAAHPGRGSRHRLARPRTWLISGIAAAGAGLALNWDWLAAIGAAPILLGLLPCAAMCALGLCMRSGSARSWTPRRW